MGLWRSQRLTISQEGKYELKTLQGIALFRGIPPRIFNLALSLIGPDKVDL
ncbi:hypothetical protein RMSM_00780 [Rhodopirellula maiorica SM1]|uniref:Uncharacterized protein n=1 Tax=Rhodopirellula maiorica SM1 TaxID=1265738 RepID=M5RSJ1_9BACT|nr:hypothetical protein RMSM_00780 [Rhodopirellula maiorica SM1]